MVDRPSTKPGVMSKNASMLLRLPIVAFAALLLAQGVATAAPPPMPPQPGQSQQPPVTQPTMLPSFSPTATPASTAAPTPAYAPTPPSGGAVMPRAREWMQRVQTGNIDRSQLSAAASAALTAQMVWRMKASYAKLGDPIAFTFVNEQNLGNGNTAYNYRVRFTHATLIEKFVLDGSGKISGLSFAPAS